MSLESKKIEIEILEKKLEIARMLENQDSCDQSVKDNATHEPSKPTNTNLLQEKVNLMQKDKNIEPLSLAEKTISKPEGFQKIKLRLWHKVVFGFIALCVIVPLSENSPRGESGNISLIGIAGSFFVVAMYIFFIALFLALFLKLARFAFKK